MLYGGYTRSYEALEDDVEELLAMVSDLRDIIEDKNLLIEELEAELENLKNGDN